MADSLKGLARGFTADVVGAPVDLMTTLANLGIAGFGFGGHKLGLLKQPPELLDPKKMVGSSDWFARGTPLEDTGSASYTAGRLGASVLPMAWSAAGKVPKPRKGQVNALYPGGRDDLILTHSTSELDEIDKGFYNLSGAITKDKVAADFGENILVLNPRKFEPRTSPTVIKNRDFYSPRRRDSWAGGRDITMPYDVAAAENFLRYYKAHPDPDNAGEIARLEKELPKMKAAALRQLANNRLADRFHTQFPDAGVRGEGSVPYGPSQLQPFGRGRRWNDEIERSTGFRAELERASPRFQSFEHFEKDPAGAATLDRGKKTDPVVFGEKLAKRMEYYGDLEKEAFDVMRRGAREGNQEAQLLLQAMRQVPSNYAETKTFGFTPFNKETVAAVVVPRNRMLRLQQGKKSIPGMEREDAALWKMMTNEWSGKGPQVLGYEDRAELEQLFPELVNLQNQAQRRK